MSEQSSQRQYVFSQEPEIIRLNQQDDYFQSYLKSKIIDAVELFTPWLFNYRIISRNEDLIKMLSGLIYYSLTTLRSTQTLGEEYAKLAQFNPNHHGLTWQNYPKVTIARKVLFVLLATVFPVVSERVVKKIYNKLKQKFSLDSKGGLFFKVFVKSLPDYEAFVQSIFKLHLAVFFIQGFYLQLSKRITSLRYIYTKRPQEHGLSFRNVGRLMLLQIVIELIKFFYKCYKTYSKKSLKKISSSKEIGDGEQQAEETHSVDETITCPLCMDVRKNTACTPCGHLFCWECIMKHCLMKEECPQCRKTCRPNKIIQIRNM